MSAAPGSALLTRFSQLLSAAGVAHRPLAGEGGIPLLEIGWRGRAGEYAALVEGWDEARRLKSWVYLPLIVPAERRGAASELLTRANCALAFGNFDFDLDRGVARLRAATVADAATLDAMTVELLVEGSLRVADAWAEGLAAVVAAGVDPAVAAAAVVARLAAAGATSPPAP